MKKYLSLIIAAAVITMTGCAAAPKDMVGTGGGTLNGAAGGAYDKVGEAYGGDAAEGITGEFGKTDIGGAGDLKDDTAAEIGDSVSSNGVKPQSGLLTGGEWNDNDHWEDWQALYKSHTEWNSYQTAWENKTLHRLAVTVTTDGKTPLEGAKVSGNGCLNSAVTDNKGRAFLFFDGETAPYEIEVSCGNESCTAEVDWVDPAGDQTCGITLEKAKSAVGGKLDLMIMCDTTGSMSDELNYLKAELEDIVNTIRSENGNIKTRVSVNFYRDTTDEYEVRSYPFSDDIDKVNEAIREQEADGGGDFPEAVHSALENAINGHDWDEDAVKIMFLVLDAPPHDDPQIIDSVQQSILKASEMGIRIIPIASSGIDKSTEYLLRTMAFTTGGTYTFLTNDSGVGNGHIEPTVGAFNVEKLNDMMVRIVNSYLD